jgi:IS4 transposase
MMGVLDLFTRRATRTWYTEDAAANDKSFGDQMLDFIEAGSVTVFDLGFFSFPLFDKFTDQQKYFVTRLREKTAYQTVAVLSEGKLYRDEIIAMGRYRSNPCTHHVRLVSVLWGQTRYRYLTNVLDDQKLSARAVCALYRHRWRIEEAFLVTKRLLGLSYLWVGARNAVQIQVYATWLFYAVLTNVCVEVAAALAQPIERISQEMVFRSLYHYARALERGENLSLVPFLVKDAKLFSLIKQERKRDREKAKQNLLVWSSLS